MTISQQLLVEKKTGDRPEKELLLCCARTYVDSKTADRIKLLLQQPIDWQCLIYMARLHGVVPLLYSNLHTIYPKAVPQRILEQLKDYYHTNTRRSFLLTAELIKILKLLEEHDIPAVPFKGPALSAFIYNNLSLREFCDLDILVRSQDILKVKELLQTQKYQPRYRFTNAQEQARFKFHHEYDFLREDGSVAIDLHWGFTEKHLFFPLKFEHLWERLQQVDLAGTKVLNLSPEDLLLILCVNGSKECWQRLERVCDVTELIRTHPNLDWNQVIKQADALGSKRMLFLGLLLASHLLEASVPLEILQKVQADSVTKILTAQVEQRIASQVFVAFDEVEKSFFYIKMRERLQDKVWYILHTMRHSGWLSPSHRDKELLQVPKSLFFLHYFIRPFRVFKKYGRLLA